MRKGGVYFHAAFLDDAFTVPVIDTYVYQGYDATDGHAFQDVDSHFAHTAGETEVEGHILYFKKDSVEWMYDKKHLIEWLEDEHSPKTVGQTYVYKAT